MPTAFPQGNQTFQEAHRSPGPQGSPGAVPVPASARRREREGGRHGRASFPESAADSAIRARLVRLAAVPCLLVAVICTAAAAFVVQTGGARLTGREWVVLCGGLALVCVIVLTASAAANAEARATVTRYARLRQVCARSQSDLYDLLDRVRQGEWIQRREPEQGAVPTGDTLDLLVHEVAAAGRAAESAVIDAVAIARSNASGSEQKVEVFVNLARRLQSLVHREIELLDELENQVEDPDLLKGLFHVDHLATRIRRHAENLAVLGGAISRRQWSRPVSMTEVLRSSIAEVEQYPRIKLVPPIEGTLHGHAVADVIHLLAELVENASIYSAPQTPVLLRAQLVTAGLAVEVEDRGLGMSADEQSRMNALLADPEHIDVAELLSDGRIGLFVVSSLARRHGIVVRLQSNIYGGVQAVLIVPQELLGEEPAEGKRTERRGRAPRRRTPTRCASTTGATPAASSTTPASPKGPLRVTNAPGITPPWRLPSAMTPVWVPATGPSWPSPAPRPPPTRSTWHRADTATVRPRFRPRAASPRTPIPSPIPTPVPLVAGWSAPRAPTLPTSACPTRGCPSRTPLTPLPPTAPPIPARSCSRPRRLPWTTAPARGCPGGASRRTSFPSCAATRSCRPRPLVRGPSPSTTPA